MPNSYAHLNLDTRTDEYSDPYEGNYGEEYAHSHHHSDGHVLSHIGTEQAFHSHPDLSPRYGHAVYDDYAIRYGVVYGYTTPSRAAAVSMAVYLTSLAHGFPRGQAAQHAIAIFHSANFYHAGGVKQFPSAKPVPDEPVRAEDVDPRTVMPEWRHNGRQVELVKVYTDLEHTLTHEHPIERGSSLGKEGETWRHPHNNPEPGHMHRYAGLGPAFNPDGSTPMVRFPHYIGNA